MAGEKEKAIEKDQQNVKPTGGKKEELSEKDLEKAAGGTTAPKMTDDPMW